MKSRGTKNHTIGRRYKYNMVKTKVKRKPNPWLIHLKKFTLANPKMRYKDAMVAAKKTYTKIK